MSRVRHPHHGALAVFMTLVIGSRVASGQSANTSTLIQMTVTDVFALTISPISTTLPVPSWVDFTAGFKDVPTPVGLTARANRSYKVTISAGSPTFGYTGSHPNPNKPRTDLQWALTAGGSYTGISTGGTVTSGASATNGTSQDVYYRTLWSISQAPPGDYSLAVSFTISAP